MQLRGFKVVSKYETKGIQLPVRKTKYSAGYDLEAAEDVSLLPGAVTLVPTGIKAYMQPDEYLGIHIRSGLSVKNKLSLVNGEGIIDADYFNNSENEGHILIAIFNHGIQCVYINKGDRIAQGIFYNYLVADHDGNTKFKIREGGLGSTGK